MKILFIGPNKLSSKHKLLCLKKNFKYVDYIDGYKAFKFNKIYEKIFWHISSKLFENQINNYFLSKIKNKKYDLIFVDSGELVGEKLIKILKKICKKIVFYCNDNPFVKRDKKKWQLCLNSLKFYDLVVFHNKSRIIPSRKLGVKKTLLVLPSYQKKVHYPLKIKNKKRVYKNDVIFIGTWEPFRGLFFKELIELGLNIKIFGGLWEKDSNYNFLKDHIRLGHVNDKKYTKLIYESRIAICIPSVGNNDDITKRSIEIPAIGTLLCALRTKTHKNVFIENKEAIFFKDSIECFKKCQKLLKNQSKIDEIANKGYIKITKTLKTDFETVIKKIVKTLIKKK